MTQGDYSNGVFGKHHGTGDIRIDLTGTFTTPAYSFSRSIYAMHCGFSSTDPSGCLRPELGTLSSGDIRINVKSFEFLPLNSSATTSGYAINAVHLGDGDVHIDARNGTITMVGEASGVIASRTRGTGNTYIYAEEVDIHTNGDAGAGIYASAESSLGPQQIEITTKELDVTTMAPRSHGIWGSNETTGDVALDVQGGTLIIHGERSHGVYSAVYYGSLSNIDIQNATIILESGNSGGNGVRNIMAGTGEMHIGVRNNTTITIKDHGSHGIYGRHVGDGDAFIDVIGSTINSESTELHPTNQTTSSHGIYVDHRGAGGSIDIDVQEARVTTQGLLSYGIYAQSRHADNVGNIDIDVRESYITTEGDGSSSIHVEKHSGTGEISVTTQGGEIRANGAGSSAIQVGIVNDMGEAERVAGLDAGGYRQQTVTVNGRVYGGSGSAAGIFLAGGGKVFIGADGHRRGGFRHCDSGRQAAATPNSTST